MTSAYIIERNASFMDHHLSEHLKILLKTAESLIDSETTGLKILLRPLVKLFYYAIVRSDIKRSGEKAMMYIVKLCKQLALDDVEDKSEAFYEILEKEFPIWLKNDHIVKFLTKRHKNYEKVKKILYEVFEWQVRPILQLLKANDQEAECYEDICRFVYKDADECMYQLDKQLIPIKEILTIIEDDVEILNVPLVKHLLIRTLQKFYDLLIDGWHEDINDIYTNKSIDYKILI
jgi:hypothetical protein